MVRSSHILAVRGTRATWGRVLNTNVEGGNVIDSKLLEELTHARVTPADLKLPSAAGIYSIYLREGGSVGQVTANPDGLVYVGVSADLKARGVETHFKTGGSKFSTLRRSIGALLKGQLDLTAIPRSPGSSKSNTRNYKFTDDGERRLTCWMEDHLEVGFVVVSQGAEDVEKAVITALEPPLNLKGWKNPQRALLKRLRAVCAAEAEQNRGQV